MLPCRAFKYRTWLLTFDLGFRFGVSKDPLESYFKCCSIPRLRVDLELAINVEGGSCHEWVHGRTMAESFGNVVAKAEDSVAGCVERSRARGGHGMVE